MTVGHRAVLHVSLASLSAVALLPALFVGGQMLTCQHSGEHWEQLVMMLLGPVCFITSAILVPFWAAGLKPFFGILWSIATFSVVGTTIIAWVS